MKNLSLFFCALFVIAGCAIGSKPTPDQLTNGTFTECPADYQEQIKYQLGKDLFDPYSAVYIFAVPEKWVYDGKFGYITMVELNAKNRFGAYVGGRRSIFYCFPDGKVKEIAEGWSGLMNGLRQ